MLLIIDRVILKLKEDKWKRERERKKREKRKRERKYIVNFKQWRFIF